MKPVLVVNPKSGGGATGRSWNGMTSAIERAIGKFETRLTERSGHGIELAREAAIAGAPLVVAVGGDGTFHEVVNGLMQAKGGGYGTKADDVQVGLIGQGTGGDFRKALGIEHRLDKYLDALKSGKTRGLDVGQFSGAGQKKHFFVNILSVGMGGLVDRYVATASRALGGTAAYFASSFKALVNAKLGTVKITVTNDGKEAEHRVRSYMIAICNGNYFGSGMKVAPMAEIDDGVFELVALGATSKLAFAMTSNSIYSGAHMQNASTVHLRGQKMVLELVNDDARDVYLSDVDGEPMGGLPLTIEAIPKALQLRA